MSSANGLPEPGTPDPVIKIAQEASSAFINGNVVGGMGGLGVLLVLASVVGPANTSLALLALGIMLVAFSGLLFVARKAMERSLILKMLDGSAHVTGEFIRNMNAGTVNAQNVIELSKQYEERLAQLLRKAD